MGGRRGRGGGVQLLPFIHLGVAFLYSQIVCVCGRAALGFTLWPNVFCCSVFSLCQQSTPPGDTPTGLTSLIFRFFIFGKTNFKFKRDTLSSLQARPCRSSPARTNMLILHFPGSTSVHGEEKSHAGLLAGVVSH